MPVHIDSVSLCIPSVILSRFYQQNLGVAAHLKNAHCDETSILLYLLNEASIYPDTTGTIKELAAFWYNFTYIEVPPSLQSLIRNEARLHKTSFFLYKLLHIININTCNMFIHIDTYNIYIYMCVYIFEYMFILYILYIMYFIISLQAYILWKQTTMMSIMDRPVDPVQEFAKRERKELPMKLWCGPLPGCQWQMKV